MRIGFVDEEIGHVDNKSGTLRVTPVTSQQSRERKPMNPSRPRPGPPTRLGVARALTATTAFAAALSTAVLAGPALAAPAAGNDPAWESAWPGGEVAGGSTWLRGSVIDPATGDVLTLGHHSVLPGENRLRRVSGATGATLWEVGLPGGPGEAALAQDPAAGRTVVAGRDASSEAVVVHSVASDGTLSWTREVVGKGYPLELVVDPRTGTSCLSSRYWTEGRTATWHLTCLDRSGTTTLSESYTHRGPGTLPVLAVDPDRQRWYVAGMHHTKGGERLVLLAYDAAGGREWKRVRDRRGAYESRVSAITVDPRSHRVHVGAAVFRPNQGTKNQAKKNLGTLTTWNAAGRLASDRRWSSRHSQGVLDLEVDPGSHRLFAATATARLGTSLRLMSSDGRLKKVVRHDRVPGIGTARLAVDAERRQVLVGAQSVGAYTWGGKRVWRDTSQNRQVSDVDHDVDRGRLVVGWKSMDDLGSQRAWVTAWES